MRHRVYQVRALSSRATQGRLVGPGLDARCALGRSGISWRKREGDGATPAGRWRIETVIVRRDCTSGPATALPRRTLRPSDGWCDQPGDRNYNRPVRHPYPASAEVMWRGDDLYDLVGVLAHNQRPRIQGAGSAVFLHLARGDFSPTAGCVALCRRDLLRLLAIGGRTMMLQTDRSWSRPRFR